MPRLITYRSDEDVLRSNGSRGGGGAAGGWKNNTYASTPFHGDGQASNGEYSVIARSIH